MKNRIDPAERKLLLYIDILGYSNLVLENWNRVDDLHEVIASLNMHNHDQFNTIVFSDTILAYNTYPTHEDPEYGTMFLAEFAKDLMQRLVGRDIAFRGVLTYGYFLHYEINGVPFFFGPALLEAYKAEKKLKAVGLFIDERTNLFNTIFPTSPFCDEWRFLYVTQSFTRIEEGYLGSFPLDPELMEDSDESYMFIHEALMLQWIEQNRSHPDEGVAAKYEATFQQYVLQYPKTITALFSDGFALKSVSDLDWKSKMDKFPVDYSYIRKDEFKRQGRKPLNDLQL